MTRFILLAEEGELSLVEQARELFGASLDDWKNAEIIFTGVGAINVIRALRELPRDSELLNIGYAGSANFDIGTWVEVTEVRLNHPNVTYKEPVLTMDNGKWTMENVKKAVCYSNCDFVLQSDYKDCVFDMELAFIAAQGFRKVHSLKYVSDNLSLHAYHDLTHGVE